MKKTFACVVLLFALITGELFAKSDLTINLGSQNDWGTVMQYFPNGYSDGYYSPEHVSGVGFAFGASNFNMFNPKGNRVLSLGFMEDITGSVGATLSINALIGFTLGANVKDVVQFRLALGPYFGFSYLIGSFAFGLGVGIEAKFIPSKRFSPLVGFRYQFDFLDTFFTMTYYAGFCINLGKLQSSVSLPNSGSTGIKPVKPKLPYRPATVW